jgi:hypothetical protein
MTYDINNTKKFIKQFTREDGLLELGKYNHDALAEAVVQDRQEAYEAGRREGAEDYKQFILNVLAGIDIADGKCNTKAIRHAIESKIINKLKQTQ